MTKSNSLPAQNTWLAFIKRHKIKLSIATVISSSLGIGGYYVYRDQIKPFLDQKRELEKMLEQMETTMQPNFDHNNSERQQENFNKHMRTGDMLLMNCRPVLRKQICELCDVDKLVNTLKEGKKGADKIKTWHSLKNVCFTRVMLGLYGLILQNAFLKVQISVASRYSDFHNNLQNIDAINKKYLEYFGHYSQVSGIKKMSKALHKAVVSIVGELNDLKKKLHANKLIEILKEIRILFETFPKEEGKSETNDFIKYLVPEDDNQIDSELRFAQMVAETKNIIQTVSFWRVISNCLDNSFNILYKQIQEGSKGERPFANIIIFMSKEHLLGSMLPSKCEDISKSKICLHLSQENSITNLCSVIYFPPSSETSETSETNDHTKGERIPRKQIKQ